MDRSKFKNGRVHFRNWPHSPWPHWVDWAVKPQHKQINQDSSYASIKVCKAAYVHLTLGLHGTRFLRNQTAMTFLAQNNLNWALKMGQLCTVHFDAFFLNSDRHFENLIGHFENSMVKTICNDSAWPKQTSKWIAYGRIPAKKWNQTDLSLTVFVTN